MSDSLRLVGHRAEDPQVVAQVARREEVLAHVLLAARARAPCRAPGRRAARAHRCGALLRRLSTRKPVSPSSICSGIPPTLPPMNGRPFQIASVTVRPKPSRVDFWMTTSACDWKALTSIAPTLLKLLRMWMSWSPSACDDRRVEEVPALGVVGRHRADERELDLRDLLLDDPVGVDHAERVLPRVEARDLAASAGGRRRCRTARRRTRRPRATAPCSSARAGRSPAGRCGRCRPCPPGT